MNWCPLSNDHFTRLKQTIQTLTARKPDFISRLPALLDQAKTLEIFEDNDGLKGVRMRSGTTERMLFPPDRGPILADNLKQVIGSRFAKNGRFLIFSGIGAGHALLYSSPYLAQYPTAGIAICEPDPYCWAAAFSLFDFQTIVSLDPIKLFAGETAADDFIQQVNERFFFLIPQSSIAYLLGTVPVDQSLTDRYIEMAKTLGTRMQQAAIDFKPAIDRFFDTAVQPITHPPKTVWSCMSQQASIHSPIVYQALAAFKTFGYETTVEDIGPNFGASFTVLGSLFDTTPDIILSLNLWPAALLKDLGLTMETAQSIQRNRLCWLLDDPRLNSEQKPPYPISPWDTFFCCDRTYIAWLKEHSPNVHFLPSGTMFDRPGTPCDEFRADISYVGSLPNVDVFIRGLPPACRDIIKRVERLKTENYERSFTAHLKTLEPSPGQMKSISTIAQSYCKTTTKAFTNPNPMVEYFLYAASTYFKRLQVVKALLPLGLRVFGPPSWRDVLPVEFQDRYGGFIPYNRLADCYTSASISLNVHSHQCPTSLNSGDFDAARAGSVDLSDWVEDADRGLLEPGKEFLTYRTVEEAEETIQRFLKDNDARETIRIQGGERVQREHTYTHRVRTMLETIGVAAD